MFEWDYSEYFLFLFDLGCISSEKMELFSFSLFSLSKHSDTSGYSAFG